MNIVFMEISLFETVRHFLIFLKCNAEKATLYSTFCLKGIAKLDVKS
jgi:hypothetical protein